MKIIITSPSAVLEGVLSMEIKKMNMVCPTAVHSGCGSGVGPCPFCKKGPYNCSSEGNQGTDKDTASRRTSGVVPAGCKGLVQT